MGSSLKKIGIFTLAMMNVSAVLSLRSLPGQADYGYAIFFYIIAASICFFIPSALVSAELASGWQENGGVYLWVKQAFGPRWGFVAIFMQWVENLPWFPAMLTFIGASLAYSFNPALADNKYFVLAVILVLLWLATWLNTKGMSWSAFLSSSGAMAGVLFPGAVLIVLAGIYLGVGDPPMIHYSSEALVPDLTNWNQLMLLVGMMVGIAGMELTSVHVTDVNNPSRNFPKAIFIATVLIVLLNILGSLAIALVVPQNSISFSAGICEAFDNIFRHFHMSWATPVICFLLAYGAMATVVTWVLGPSKGLLEVAREGYLPKYWQGKNANGMPQRILVLQAVISSVLALSILVMPSVSSAFWLMTALTAQLYMVMYLLMFAAAIKLRYSQPDVPRPYRVPGGKFGIWAVSGIAFLTSLAAIAFGFIPPPNVVGLWPTIGYIAFLLIGMVVFILLPLVLYHRAVRRRKAVPTAAAE